jgi:hypothetical protein
MPWQVSSGERKRKKQEKVLLGGACRTNGIKRRPGWQPGIPKSSARQRHPLLNIALPRA